MEMFSYQRDTNPVDLLEDLLSGRRWEFERHDDEINISVTGQWSEYELSLSWLEDRETLHMACSFPVNVPQTRQSEMFRLIGKINERLLVGHFDLWDGNGSLVFRQGLILSGGAEPTQEQFEQLLSCALEACEQYYEAFQYVIWAGRTADQALEVSLFETKGSA